MRAPRSPTPTVFRQATPSRDRVATKSTPAGPHPTELAAGQDDQEQPDPDCWIRDRYTRRAVADDANDADDAGSVAQGRVAQSVR